MSIDKNTGPDNLENNSDKQKKLSPKEARDFLEQQKTRQSAEKTGVNKDTGEKITQFDTKLKLTTLKESVPNKNNLEKKKKESTKSTDYMGEFQQKGSFTYEYRDEYKNLIASAQNAPENQNSFHAAIQGLKYLGNTSKDIGISFIKDACNLADYKKLPKYILDNA